jgi:hypothetical protein
VSIRRRIVLSVSYYPAKVGMCYIHGSNETYFTFPLIFSNAVATSLFLRELKKAHPLDFLVTGHMPYYLHYMTHPSVRGQYLISPNHRPNIKQGSKQIDLYLCNIAMLRIHHSVHTHWWHRDRIEHTCKSVEEIELEL